MSHVQQNESFTHQNNGSEYDVNSNESSNANLIRTNNLLNGLNLNNKEDGFANRIGNYLSFYDFDAKDIDGTTVRLKALCKDAKATLIVNIAPVMCGFTNPNLTMLNELYAKYKSFGLQILAYPCDDFTSRGVG